MFRRSGLCAALLLTACPQHNEHPPEDKPGPPVLSHELGACVEDGVDGKPHPGQHCVTYRAIAGVSMGGGAAARIALQNPELFDVVGSLGSPYIDMEYFLFSVGKVANGGFCPEAQLLANLQHIDDKDNPLTWCGPVPFKDQTLPDTLCTGFAADFNHQYRGPSAGRGGSFDREGSFDVVEDLALAFGNPGFYNPDNPYMPTGVPLSQHVPLELDADDKAAERAAARAEICAHPTVLTGFVDPIYNPTGEYPVITFCDGNGPIDGEYEPDLDTYPMEVALAVDYNRNNKRDYGEPVVVNGFEPFDDFGVDGIPDAMEPGYDPVTNPDPNHDDYDWLHNPKGTEANFRYDVGEHFSDVGLDGKAGTGDMGEGNGVQDVSPNLINTLANSPRKLMEQISDRMLSRLHIWADSGIRDFLNSAVMTNQFWGALMQRSTSTRLVTDWSELATVTGQTGTYAAYWADLSTERVGRHVYLRYGDPSVCPGVDAENGRGNHVGPASEILDRLRTVFAFGSARFENGDFTELPSSLEDLGGPTQTLSDFILNESFPSVALGRDQPYSVILPPDYYVKPDNRYPVIYFLHGQGQKASDLAASGLLFLGPQMASDMPARVTAQRSDWQKMIIVFADGECHPGECHTGTFYVDFKGIDGHGPRHGEAFFELMRRIDTRFRTKLPEMRPGDGPAL